MSAAENDVLTGTAQTQLRSIVERIERLEQEKTEITEQIKEVFAEAKGNGFDVKVLRKVVRRRKQDRAKLQEEEAILDLYLSALGELPLFEARPAASPQAAPPSDISVTITTPGGPSVTAPLSHLTAVAADLDLYDQAVAVVKRDRKASTAYVQRKLQIGYNKAASFMERMEAAGIVSAPNHAGKREILAAEALQ